MVRHRLCVGVDIGTSGVKLCQLREAGKELRLVTYASCPLPADTVVDGAVMNAGRVVEALQQLIEQEKVREKRVALAISGNSVTIKNMTMPRMGRRELEASVQFEAEQIIPFALKDVFLDVQILGPNAADPTQMDVLVVAAKKDFISEYTAVLAEAGLEPVVCDIDPFAVETAFARNYGFAGSEGIALVNIGAAKTSINVVVAGKSRFTRDLSLGGNTFTAEIQRALACNFDEAERLKLAEKAAEAPQVKTALDTVMHTIADEVVHTCEYFAASHPYPLPTQIYLSGGTASMPGLLAVLAGKISATCEVVDPFRKVLAGPQNPLLLQNAGPRATVAVGLAMRYVGDC